MAAVFDWDACPYYTQADYNSAKAGLIALMSGQRVVQVTINGTVLAYDHRAANINELSAAVDKIYRHLQSMAGRRMNVLTSTGKGIF